VRRVIEGLNLKEAIFVDHRKKRPLKEEINKKNMGFLEFFF